MPEIVRLPHAERGWRKVRYVADDGTAETLIYYGQTDAEIEAAATATWRERADGTPDGTVPGQGEWFDRAAAYYDAVDPDIAALLRNPVARRMQDEAFTSAVNLEDRESARRAREQTDDLRRDAAG